jgi:pimeloyl-ACP methyl ester carboxylesterase
VRRKTVTITEPYASSVPRFGRLRRWQRIALTLVVALIALLIGGVLYGAYGYQPPEAGRGYDPPYLQQVDSRFVETPVARFHYVHAGEGSPVILVSPGSAWVVAWKHQFSALAEHHSVYVVDLPGQGYTELKDPNFRWDLTGMTGALGSVMDAVGVHKAAIAGNSWSGGWALAFAQRHPERVSKLMLLDSCGLDVRDPWEWEILKYPVAGELLTNLFTTKSTVRGAAENSLVHRELVTDELVSEYWAPMTFHDNRRANYLLERGLNWQETERAMPTTETPTLVLWGSEDNVLPAWQAERFGQLLPDARVHVFDGCGHPLEYDCPVRTNHQMEAFLDER